jgi:polygalacturonase
MTSENTPSLSRREWFSRAAAPVAAATVAYPLLVSATSRADAQQQTLETKLAIFDIRDFGAVGDGAKLNTKEIQAAIDAANAAQGGTVLVPSGTFLCGTIELKSNVTFHLATNARLLGSPKPEDYRAGNNIPPGNGNIVFISAADAENFTISGNGTIDGNGLAFWTGQGDNTGPGQGGVGGYFDRPHLLIFARCKNIRVQDVYLTASAYHCMRILNCEYVYFERIRINNRVNKNNDGFHFNDSRYVHIDGCDVRCQDDACALFGSNKFVTVANCSFSTRWSIFRFGGGSSENITVTNCLIYETFGCVIKMGAGRNSRHENMIFSNLIFRDVTGPISLGLSDQRRTPRPGQEDQPSEPGVVRNIVFSNIHGNVVASGRKYDDMHWEQGYRPGETRTCITLNSFGESYLENITLSNIHLTFEGGGTAEEAQLRDVPQIAGEYFEIGARPAHGVYARNIRGLTLDNVHIETATPDLRPAVVLDNVSDAAISDLTTQGNPAGPSVIRCINTTDALISSPRLLSPAAVYMAVEGNRSADITLDGGDIRKAGEQVSFGRGATEKAARLRT